MKISVITVLYNEEFLLPFFLKHYQWVDEIRVLFDSDTNDRTLDICQDDPKVIVQEFTFPDMMDATIKQQHIHRVFNSLDCDWVIVIDCDEFIFPFPCEENPREVFEKIKGNLVYAHMWSVYRHREDEDINPNTPIYEQRRHGADMSEGWNSMYIKPCIAKRETDIVWGLGCHNYFENPKLKMSDYQFQGAHWKMADPDLAIKRRIASGRDRQSKANLSAGYQVHDHDITEQMILDECKKHLDDPVLF